MTTGKAATTKGDEDPSETHGEVQTTEIGKKNKYEEVFKSRTFFTAVGRRKTAIAQVRLYADGKGRLYVNKAEYRKYFSHFDLQKKITKPLDLIKEKQNFDISAWVHGGGLQGQADALALAISRAILKWSPDTKEKLKAVNLLTRDARVKERKKPGLKRARRAPQWQKR